MLPLLLATCTGLPNGDDDASGLIDALDRHGVDARWAVWDDPTVDWSDTPVVLRSTWDYTLHRERFLEWLGGVSQAHNPASVVAWNSDKTYLLDLAAAGIAITPTVVADVGAPLPVPDSPEFVVKPSVGAGSRGAGRFDARTLDDANAHAEALHAAGKTVLVQPYLADVDEHGETALIYFDGVLSHAIRKGAMLGGASPYPVDESAGLYIAENISARTPSEQESALGDAVMDFVAARFGGPLVYARVDLLPSAGGPVVVELELTEPSLFLGFGPGAVDRVAAAIAARLASGR